MPKGIQNKNYIRFKARQPGVHKIYKERAAVERVIAYLKEFFQFNNIRFRTSTRAKIHFELVTLVYNAAKLACDRFNSKLQVAPRAA